MRVQANKGATDVDSGNWEQLTSELPQRVIYHYLLGVLKSINRMRETSAVALVKGIGS
ncbi:MAG: hypothetical protein OFPII_31150 [Osedax symbiont Rs1]|nr:MAG: hypothetical protein OFPII_31150 [Osedax symbiont Rs1]